MANPRAYSDSLIAGLLRSVRTIALVGASANPAKASFIVMKYMQGKGYRVIPVNPGLAGKTLLGETVYASLDDLPVAVDMVDVFRNAAAVPPLAETAIRIGARVLWLQLGIINQDAAAMAEAAGLTVVMDRCPKMEFGRLSGEMGFFGVDSRIISARRERLI
jgi:predicted CoA-binding protein